MSFCRTSPGLQPPKLPPWASRCLVCLTVEQTAQTARWLWRLLSGL